MSHSTTCEDVNRMNHLVIKFSIKKALIYLYLICVLTPYIQSYYLLIPCMIGVAFCIVTIPQLINELSKDKFVFLSLFLLLLSFLYKLLGISDGAWGNYGHYFLVFVSFWIGFFCLHYLTNEEIKKIGVFFCVILGINTISNIRIFIQYPNMNSALKGTMDFEMLYGRTNVGGTAFKYIVFFAAFFLLCILITTEWKKRSRILRLWLLSLFVIFSVFTFVYSTTGTIIFCVIITFPLLLIFGKAKSYNQLLFWLIFLILGLLVIAVFFNPIMEAVIPIIENISGEKVARRFVAIKNLFSGGVSSSDIGIFERITLIGYDIKTFFSSFKNFLIGNGYHTYSATNTLSSAIGNGDGGHSGIFDLIVRYGLIGLISMFSLIGSFKNYIRSNIVPQSLAIISFYTIIFNNIFNDMFDAGIFACIFILVDLIYAMSETNSDIKEYFNEV